MKRLLLFILLAAFTANSFAQNQRLTMGAGKMQNETVLVQQRSDETIIKFNLNEVELIEVDTDYGKAFIPMSDDAPLMLEKGSPELLYLTSTFIIPDTGDSELEIAYGDYQEFEHIEIAPSKGNLSRSIDPQTVPYVKGNIYQKDGFYPEVLANLREPFIMRDLRGQSVDVYPIQYNPVTKVLRIYSEITVKVKNISQTGISEFTGHKRHSSIDPEFDAIYGSLFINHTGVAQERGYPTGEEGEILIICHHAFMNAMKPYVDWKRTIGRKTTMVSTAVITPSLTAANIWTYIHNYYNNPANNLAYVLLVGDYAEILPRVYSSGQHSHSVVSNNYFGQLSGTNSSPSTYMDVLIGRMSAQAAAHVETQVQRTIWYERDLTTSDTWLSAAIGIATNEGGGGGHDGAELDYVHMNNIRTRLMTYGYTPVYQEYGAGSGVTTTTVANISARFNSGVGMANYCNHGSEIAWTLSSGYSSINYGVANVNALTNNGKLPYIFSVACLNGRFNHTSDCFAEAWMRRQYNDQPAGAVATLMASVSIAWAPPMTAQDEFVNICMDLASPYPGTQPGIKRTFAGAALNATQKMLLRHGTGALNLGDFNSWNVFGDPTLMIRTKTPQAMTVSYDPFISIGVNDFTVDCDTEGALVTMSYIDSSDEVIILGTGTVVGGTVNLTLNETIASNGTITIAVVARDRVTYVGEILAASPCERPVNLSADTEINTVILNWDNSDSMDGVLLGYDIYCNGSKINTSLITAQEYRDENLTNGTYTYQVVSVYDDGCQSPPSTSITMVIELYAVNYQSPQNGSLSVMAGTATIANGSLVNVGSLLSITATPNDKYILETLTVNGSDFTSGNNHTVTETTTINAVFRGIDATLTNASVNGNDINNISDDIPYMASCGEGNIVLILNSEGPIKVNGTAYTPGMTIPFNNDKVTLNIEISGIPDRNYTLNISKALGSSAMPMYVQRWGKTLAVVNNPDYNGGHTFDNYQWYRHGALLPGSTGGYILLNGYMANEYTAEVYSATTASWHKLCYNVREQAATAITTVFPNPVNAGQLLNLNLPDNVNSVNVNIYNINGSLVRQEKGVQTAVTMPNQTGMYVIEIHLPDGSKDIQQVIVQ